MKSFIVQIVTLALIVNCLAGAFFVELPAGRFDFFRMQDAMDHLFSVSLIAAVFVTSFILLQALLSALYRPVKRKNREKYVFYKFFVKIFLKIGYFPSIPIVFLYILMITLLIYLVNKKTVQNLKIYKLNQNRTRFLLQK